MAEDKPAIGSIAWCDLTIENAGEIRDFYRQVVGWTASEVNMGDYSDYCMNQPADETTVAGVCHLRGGNSDLPPAWLIYVIVEDLDQSLEACRQLGGSTLTPIKSMGSDRYCVIKDPAGAAMALYEKNS